MRSREKCRQAPVTAVQTDANPLTSKSRRLRERISIHSPSCPAQRKSKDATPFTFYVCSLSPAYSCRTLSSLLAYDMQLSAYLSPAPYSNLPFTVGSKYGEASFVLSVAASAAKSKGTPRRTVVFDFADATLRPNGERSLNRGSEFLIIPTCNRKAL